MNIAVLACLLKYKHCFVSVENATLKVYSELEKSKKLFSLNHIPILFTFGIINNKENFLED